jgi:hypothetical protein
MPTKTFTSGRIRKAEHDASSGQLDLHWDNGTVTAYKQVPQEVYRRLCSVPNPATYSAVRPCVERKPCEPARPSRF